MNKIIHVSNPVAQLLIYFITIFSIANTSASVQLAATNTQLTIATAANFRATLNELLVEFKKQLSTGITINVISGSTGSLYQQIVSGAPFDVYFSADNKRPAYLIEKNLTNPTLIFPYARGEIILAVKPTAAQVAGFKCDDNHTAAETISNTRLLLNTSNKIVIANPRIAPYGHAASEFLKTIYPDLNSAHSLTIAKAKNVIHAQQLFENTNAPVAILSKAQAFANTKKTFISNSFIYCPIPTQLYSDIIQTAAIITHANSSIISIKTALALKDFIHTKTAEHIIFKNGYFPINNTVSLLKKSVTSSK